MFPSSSLRSPAPDIAPGVADETYRLYRNVRWRGPLGLLAACSVLTALLQDRIPATALWIWTSTVLLATVAMTAGFAVPALARRRAPTGLPQAAKPTHAVAGAALGSVLWIAPEAANDPLAWWPIVAIQLAVTAGAASGVSGLGYTMAVSMWTLTSSALLVNSEWLMGSATTIFLLMVIGYQSASGAMWRELIVLRVRHEELARANAIRATHDELTGLLNRRGIIEAFESGALTTNTAMFVDLDHFKRVNDRFGHGVGDEVLVEAAHRLRDTVGDRGHIGRIGGDEFVVAFTQPLDNTQAELLGHRLIEVLERPFRAGHGLDVRISASVGFSTDSEDPARLISEADHAMLQAKRRGRRQVVGFADDPEPTTTEDKPPASGNEQPSRTIG